MNGALARVPASACCPRSALQGRAGSMSWRRAAIHFIMCKSSSSCYAILTNRNPTWNGFPPVTTPSLYSNEAVPLYESAIRAGTLAVLATVLDGPFMGGKLCFTAAGNRAGTLGTPDLDAAALPLLEKAILTHQTARHRLEAGGELHDIFLDVQSPPLRLIIIGAVHSAIALVEFANRLGFATTVLDARSAFATPARFAHAGHLHVAWPADTLAAITLDEGCYIVALTHDEKIDNPALALALTSPARYVGALGSRRTHAKRLEWLRAAGVPEEALARIHAPIGLSIGAQSPEEIALSIMAQIVAVKNSARTPERL